MRAKCRLGVTLSPMLCVRQGKWSPRAPTLRWALAVGLLALSPASLAETVYKAMDEQGNVTYSSVRPSGAAHVERVVVSPAPRAEERAAAQARAVRLKAQGAQLEEKRKESAEAKVDHWRELQEAEDELRRAERNYEAAESSRYNRSPARIQATQEALEAARKRVVKLRR